jgi:ribosome-associated heat shock protein Hsp15
MEGRDYLIKKNMKEKPTTHKVSSPLSHREGQGESPQSLARIDKWLWAARIFKTRSIAADAIKNGRVTMGGVNVKPSRMVKAGETVSVRKPPVTYSFKILKPIEQRVGAKLLPEIYENVTPADQYELLEMNRISGFVNRARGTGRPTKKERRALDEFIGPVVEDFDDFDWED